MFRELLKFEWRYHTGTILFYVAAGAFLFFGFMFSLYGLKMPHVHMNSPYLITYILGMLSLGTIFIITLFGTNSLLRDNEHKMSEIVYASSVSRFSCLFSRFVGLMLVSCTAFSFAMVGIFLSSYMPWVDITKLGATNIGHYFWGGIVLVLPNMLFCSSLLFLVAALSRNRLAMYVGGLFIYILYIAGSIFSNAPWLANAMPATAEAMSLAAKLDPFGISAFFEQTRYWTPFDRNTRLIALEGNFLFNRVLWLSFSSVLLALSYKLFSLRIVKATYKKKKVDDQKSISEVAYKIAATQTNTKVAQWQAFISLTRIELLTIVRSLPFVVVFLLWLFLMGTETWSLIDGGARMSPDYPTTGKIIKNIIRSLPLVGLIVIIFYSNEQIWRNRSLQIDELLDVTPASNLAFYASKFIVLALLIFLLIVVGIGVGVFFQLIAGYYHFEPLLYLSIFYYAGLPLLQIAALAFFMQVVVPNKYLGMLLTCLIVLFTNTSLGTLFGIVHPMLRYAAPMASEYSDMNGFGKYAEAFHWRMIYWGAMACLLALLGCGVWSRGKEVALKNRLRTLGSAWGNTAKMIAAICVLIFSGSGSFIFYHTNILREYITKEEKDDWREAYERTYKQYKDLPFPTITDVKAEVDLYPNENRYEVRGYYKVLNKTEQPIERVLVGISKALMVKSLTLSSASLQETDENFRHYWFKFDKPLQPGEHAAMSFTFEYYWSGFHDHSPFNSIIGNGSFIRMSNYFPFLGYNTDNELENPDKRRKRGLSDADEATGSLEEYLQNYADSVIFSTMSGADAIAQYDYINFETVVSTSSDQTVIAPGNLVKEWTDKGRRYFHYQVDKPIPFRFAYASAKYQVVKSLYKGVAIEVYHDSKHAYNTEHIIESLRQAIDYCTEQFGPYQYKHVRFAEISQFTSGFAATAYPNTIYAIENRGFVSDLRDTTAIHYFYQGIVHEFAHQWWGGQLNPAFVEGSMVLTETLTQYTEFMIYEKIFGKEKTRKALAVELDIYLSGRGMGKERPLYTTTSQPTVAYNKGAVVMYAIKELIGEKAVNSALKSLLNKHAYPKPRATTYHLLEELYAVSPKKYHYLLEEWIKKIVLYDARVEDASYKQLKDDRFEVSLKINVKKFEEDGTGKETPLAVDEELWIGIFSEDPNISVGKRREIYLQKHYFNGGTTELKVVVDKKPQLAAIDPYILLIDQDRKDNFRTLEAR